MRWNRPLTRFAATTAAAAFLCGAALWRPASHAAAPADQPTTGQPAADATGAQDEPANDEQRVVVAPDKHVGGPPEAGATEGGEPGAGAPEGAAPSEDILFYTAPVAGAEEDVLFLHHPEPGEDVLWLYTDAAPVAGDVVIGGGPAGAAPHGDVFAFAAAPVGAPGGPPVAVRVRPTSPYPMPMEPPARMQMEKAAHLGVGASPAPPVLRKQVKLPKGVGLVVDFVEPGSPAEAAGLQEYDVLHKLDDQILIDQHQFTVLVRTHNPGDEVKLTVIREGQSQVLTAKLDEKEMPVLPEGAPGGGFGGGHPPVRILTGPVPPTPFGGHAERAPMGGRARLWTTPIPPSPVGEPRMHRLRLRGGVGPAPEIHPLPPGMAPGMMPGRPGGHAPPPLPDDYQIGNGDVLTVTIPDLGGPGKELVKRVRVSGSGTVHLPYLERLTAAGMTAPELEKSIAESYEKAGVIQNAQVAVEVQEVYHRPRAEPGTGLPGADPAAPGAEGGEAERPGAGGPEADGGEGLPAPKDGAAPTAPTPERRRPRGAGGGRPQ